MVNKTILKIILFIFMSFSQSGFILMAWDNPALVPLMCYSWVSATIILAISLFYLFGGAKSIRGWWNKKMMQEAQKRQLRRAVEEEVKKRMQSK